MRIQKTEALVLRRTDFSDTSQILDLFTRERGRVAVIAKGARRYRKRAYRLIDVLYHGHAIVLEKTSRDVQILADFDTVNHFPGLRRHLDRLHAGLHTAHLLRRATRPEAADRRLFALALKALARFASAPLERLGAEIIAFDARFLAVIGYELVLARCPQCAARHAPRDVTYFQPRAGGCLCRRCRPPDPRDATPFSAAGRRLLLDLARLTAPARDGIACEPAPAREVRKILNTALTSGLEGELPMLRYIPPPTPS